MTQHAIVSFCLWFILALPSCYLVGSAWESYFHELVLDRAPFIKCRGYRKDGWLSELWFARFSHHSLHHHLTYRTSYVRQFSSPEDEQALICKLERLLDSPQLRSVIASRFGARFTWTGAVRFALPLFGLALCATAACPVGACRTAFLSAILLGTTPYLVFSRWAHAYLHQPFDLIGDAPRLLRALLRFRYGLAMRVGHFVHRRHPDSNYNLQLGYDLLRRRWRAPSDADWKEMLAIGLVTISDAKTMQHRNVCMHPF